MQSPHPDKKYICFNQKPPDQKETQEAYQERCIQSFRDRYHVEPAQSFVLFRMLWVGPVPSKDKPKKAMYPGNARSSDTTRSPNQLNLFQEHS